MDLYQVYQRYNSHTECLERQCSTGASVFQARIDPGTQFRGRFQLRALRLFLIKGCLCRVYYSLRSKRFRGAKSEETGFSAFCPREK